MYEVERYTSVNNLGTTGGGGFIGANVGSWRSREEGRMFNDANATVLAKTILMTVDAAGGVLTYALALAPVLARWGTTVHLAMMGPKPRPAQAAKIHATPGVVLHESSFALEWMDDPWADVARAATWLRDLEREVRPDLIHLNGYCHGAAGFTAPVIIVAHSCVLSWRSAVEGALEDAARDATYKEAVKRGLVAADAVIAVSQAMRASLERHYGPLPRTAVVPNGLPAPDRRSADKEPFILAAGRVWDRAKNVEALARVADRLPWPVKVAGWGADALEGATALGWLSPEELGAVMDRASIFALPAKYEPFGLSALEAALRGCALVLGDLPSQREIWGDAALYVRPDDEAGLIEALSALTSDHETRAQLAETANLRARLYTPERTARAMRDLYEAIILARRVPALPLERRETRTL